MNDIQYNNLKEQVNHGDFILPFKTYSGRIDENDPIINIHWHNEIEMVIVEDGECDCMINLENYTAKKGNIILIKPLVLHSLTTPKGKTMDWNTIIFDLNILKSAITDGCLIKYLAPILNNEHELPKIINSSSLGYSEILNCLKSLIKIYSNKEEAFELELKANLFHLFFLFYKYNLVTKNSSKKEISTETEEKIKNILNYIHTHYFENISIEDLSQISSFSEYHFMKFFKKHIGMTSIEYINNYRLEKASALLSSTDKSIMEISLDVGFNSVSYFNKLFKNKYKLTPKEFRIVEKEKEQD